MTGNNTTMAILAVATGLLAGLTIFLTLRTLRRRASVNADVPPAGSTPAAAPLTRVAPVLPSAPLTATVHYTDGGGQSSVREVVIQSRTLKGELSHGLNIRDGSDGRQKIFLIDRISRLEYPAEGELRCLTSAGQIRELLEQVIPLQKARRIRLAAPEVEPPAAPEQAAQEMADTGSEPQDCPLPLASLLPEGARGFAVIDLETTGFGADHRILEIAVIRLDPDGRLIDVWETLVHPGMPIPHTKAQEKHRLQDWMVTDAPSFAAMAPDLAARLDGHVLVAHNLPFDQGFLDRRFAAAEGIVIDLGKGLNTMQSRESLESLCLRLGVELPPEEAHSALADAWALQQALLAGIAHLQPARAAVQVQQSGTKQTCTLQTRAAVLATMAPEGWSRRAVPLKAGAEFIKTDVSEASAEALATRLGLVYRKAQKVPVRRSPAFLIAEDLRSTNTKMREAKQRGLPVLLLRDLASVTAGAEAMGWVFVAGEEGVQD